MLYGLWQMADIVGVPDVRLAGHSSRPLRMEPGGRHGVPPSFPWRLVGMPGIAVLVVDDDETVRETLISLLNDEGYEATGAHDGGEALLALLGAERPSVVL